MHSEEIVSHIDALLRELRDNRSRLERARTLLITDGTRSISSLPRRSEGNPRRKVTVRGAKPDNATPGPVRSGRRPALARSGAAVVKADTSGPDAAGGALVSGQAVLPVDRRVMIALIERSPGISTHEIAEQLTYDPGAVRRILMRMQEQGEAASTMTDKRQLWSIVSDEIRDAERMAELEAALSGSHDNTAPEQQDAAGSVGVALR